MKHLLITLVAVMLLSVGSQAQTKVYGTIIANVKLTTGRATLEVFFGENQETYSSMLKDEKGNLIKFESLIDAMNHLSKFGWELEETYATLIGSGMAASTAYYWVISKNEKEKE